MYGTTTALTQITGSLTDTGTLVTAVVASIAVGLVALMGLGFLFRHIRKILGRKF